MVVEVSTIPGGRAVIAEGPTDVGLEGCTSITTGGVDGFGDLFGSIGSPALGDGGIDDISRRTR